MPPKKSTKTSRKISRPRGRPAPTPTTRARTTEAPPAQDIAPATPALTRVTTTNAELAAKRQRRMRSLNSIKEKFDGTGYDIYKLKTLGLMKLEGLRTHLLEKAQETDQQTPEYIDDREDAMIFLLATLDAKIIRKYPNLKDPHDLWIAIEREYEKLERSEKALLKKELGNINLSDCKDIDDYIMQKQEKLGTLLNAGIKYSQEDQVDIFIAGLTSDYNQWANSLQDKDMADIEKFIILLRRHAKTSSILGANDKHKESTVLPPELEAAFNTFLAQNKKRKQSEQHSKPQTNPFINNQQSTCFTCGKPGHSKRNCFKNQTCTICNKKGHIEKFCYHRQQQREWQEQPEDDAQANMAFIMTTHEMAAPKETTLLNSPDSPSSTNETKESNELFSQFHDLDNF
jgi:hypothetical protein